MTERTRLDGILDTRSELQGNVGRQIVLSFDGAKLPI
jgi:hypothetical protein